MEPIHLVHLSDLHFTPDKDMRIWNRVVNFINRQVKPDAILITGDMTDNATHKEFICADSALRQLQIREPRPDKPPYQIVPGNHDRYAFMAIFAQTPKAENLL